MYFWCSSKFSIDVAVKQGQQILCKLRTIHHTSYTLKEQILLQLLLRQESPSCPISNYIASHYHDIEQSHDRKQTKYSSHHCRTAVFWLESRLSQHAFWAFKKPLTPQPLTYLVYIYCFLFPILQCSSENAQQRLYCEHCSHASHSCYDITEDSGAPSPVPSTDGWLATSLLNSKGHSHWPAITDMLNLGAAEMYMIYRHRIAEDGEACYTYQTSTILEYWEPALHNHLLQ